MITTIIIFALTCISLILSVLFFPKTKVFKKEISTYWIVSLLGALLMIVFNKITFIDAFNGITIDSSVNPIKILILFISLTLLSVFLDEIGFFKHLAYLVTKKAKTNQTLMFIILYIVISILTIFTSNDIVILTFTPFICYFAKNAKINPLPYLIGEFVAANTWSMMLVIGNPTNIYLATSAGIDFISYFKVMFLPTVIAGLVEIGLIYLLFNKQLKEPLNCEIEDEKIKDKPSLVVGLIHLVICFILLIISSYINFEMWIICLASCLSLVLFTMIYSFKNKKKFSYLKSTLKHLPWELIPFVLSMFIIVIALNKQGIVENLQNLFGENNLVYKYGYSSYLASNMMNNIPMSVLFASVCQNNLEATYATIIGSNIGAFLTPIGALAGIMFTNLVNKQNIKYSFKDFIKYGIIISVPVITVALLILNLVL